jgi:hypothetical protein
LDGAEREIEGRHDLLWQQKIKMGEVVVVVVCYCDSVK